MVSKRLKYLVAGAAFVTSGNAYAQNCANVIALSKYSSDTIASETEIESHAANFCRNYENFRSRGGSSNFGIGFKFLQASMGSTSNSVDQVAAKYCSAANSSRMRDSAFEQYVESIAPGAFDAYNQCIQFSNRDVKFEFTDSDILADRFFVGVQYRPSGGTRNSARFRYEASSGVSCTWNGLSRQDYMVSNIGTANLVCTRSNFQEKDAIIISRIDGIDRISLPWRAYSTDRVPVDTVASLNVKIDEMNNRLASVKQDAEKRGIQTGTFARPLRGRCRGGGVDHLGTVRFAKPFAEKPEIVMGFNSLEHLQDSAHRRLSVSLVSADINGFTYKWNTLCGDNWREKVRAHWMAYLH